MEQSYDVVFSGEMDPERAIEAIREDFAKLFKLDELKAKRIFSAPRVVLKKNLSAVKAQRYQQRLAAIGMRVVLRPSASAAATGAGLSLAPREALPAAPAEPPPAVTERAASGDVRPLPFRFDGEGAEFFRIWIVNVLLTIVTLGVYSAWAKVRTQQYFYGNTYLDASSFQYHAKPMTILRGRLIAVGAFIVYSLAAQFWPPLAVVLMLIFATALPWLVTRSLKFQAVNSSYRNIRFDFRANYWQAAKTYLPLLAPALMMIAISIGTAMLTSNQEAPGTGFSIFIVVMILLAMGVMAVALPYWQYLQHRLVMGHLFFGKTSFEFASGVREYFSIYLRGLGLLLVCVALIAVLAAIHPVAVLPGVIALYTVPWLYLYVRLVNHRYNATSVGPHHLTSDIEMKGYFLLSLGNLVGMVLTLGLFYPWAKVRLARYRLQNMSLLAAGELDTFVADERAEASAVGDEMSELFDVGVAF